MGLKSLEKGFEDGLGFWRVGLVRDLAFYRMGVYGHELGFWVIEWGFKVWWGSTVEMGIRFGRFMGLVMYCGFWVD